MKKTILRIFLILLLLIVILLLIRLVSNAIRNSGLLYTPPAKDEWYTQKRSADGVKMVQVDPQNQVWTQKIGSGTIPLLLLHGGPGATHEYFENFPQHLDTSVYTIYFYDQLGSFFSDNPNNRALWKVDRFVEEVETVRKALGLQDFYLLGHSWGGLLALEYSYKYQQHLKGLLISNAPFTKEGTSEYRKVLLKNTKDHLNAELGREAGGKEIRREYERIHRYGLDTIPEPFERLNQHYNHHPRKFKMFYYNKYWPALHEKAGSLNVPVLIIGSEKDFVDPKDFELMHEKIPNSKLVMIPNGPHFAMWSHPTLYFQAIENFTK